MTKQEILDLVEQDSSTIREFFNEHRHEIDGKNESQFNYFFTDILDNINNDKIPELIYERISMLIKALEIQSLRDNMQLYIINKDLGIKKINEIILNLLFSTKTYNLLKAIDFVTSNVVLIGANGSGKTTFANSIRKKLEITDNGIVIPAQKILIFPTYDSIPAQKTANTEYAKRQKETISEKETYKCNNVPYGLFEQYGTELQTVTSTLIAEKFAKANHYCTNAKEGDLVRTDDFKSTIDEVIEIWNKLLEHRELFCDDSGNLQIKCKDNSTIYPANRMSSGEKEIFYIIGRVLLTKESSLIIVDEPEIHLHKAILNKLWDILEERRKDCMFIYLTHDIDFASTRIAKKYWLKSFTDQSLVDWELEPITNSNIPEDLLMQILGSRKKILFCEGCGNSLDVKIFEMLFPNYTITPVETCKNVMNFTRAFNKIENKYAEAFGIIDRDFRNESQLKALKKDNIYSYEVAEIENLFLIDEFILGFSIYKKERCNIENIKNEILKLLQENKIKQVSAYVIQKINYNFKESNLDNAQNENDVRKHFDDFISQIKIKEWYDERLKELDSIINNKDYKKAIKVYNNKGLKTVVEKNLNLSSYQDRALMYLKDSEEARIILRKEFPTLI